MEARALNIALHIGSLRRAAWSRRIADELIALAPSTLKLQPVPIGELPLYNADLETATPPPAWSAYRTAIVASDGLLFVSPNTTAA
jgi:chromate reductase, NAD(P)H dehydrogenase (quinone)